MNKNDDLEILTNQRVRFTLGGKEFTARRGTVGDAGRAAKFVAERKEQDDNVNLEIDSNLYILSECMKPDFNYTYQELADMMPFNELLRINDIMETLGFQDPRLLTTSKKKK